MRTRPIYFAQAAPNASGRFVIVAWFCAEPGERQQTVELPGDYETEAEAHAAAERHNEISGLLTDPWADLAQALRDVWAELLNQPFIRKIVTYLTKW